MTRSQVTMGFWRFSVGLTPLFIGVLVLRGWQSLDRLPADPGYGWVLRASNEGVASIAINDPYFRVQELTVAWIVSFFPIATHALLLSALSHLAWAVGAVVVAWMTLRVVNSWSTAALIGALVVLSPHAAESVLGNHGNVRWILLIVLVTVVSVPPEFVHRGIGVALFVIVTGLSNPIAGVCLLPMAVRSIAKRHIHPNDKLVGGWLAISVVIQVTRALMNGFLGGHSNKITMPWDGMGIFWWSGLLGPIVAAITALALLTVFKRGEGLNLEFPRSLAIMSLVIHGVSYLLGGIADRYFVTPMTLSCMALLIALHFQALRSGRNWQVARLTLVLVFLVPALKWFSASAYLASGPTWSSEIEHARKLCDRSNESTLQISLSAGGRQELSCDDLN